MTSDITDLQLRRDVLLAFQVALLGMVGHRLRGVTVAWSDCVISGRLLFDGELGADEAECASDVEAEIAASFPTHEIEVVAQRYDAPEPLNERGLMAWVYRRKE